MNFLSSGKGMALALLLGPVALGQAQAQTRPHNGPYAKVLEYLAADKFTEALAELSRIKGDKVSPGRSKYLEGLIYNRMKDFPKASKALEAAKARGHQEKDLDYELGQSYYAQNDLDKAIQCFERSFSAGFKPDTSMYYVAYSQQLMERYKEAKDAYGKVLKIKDLGPELRQAASFQLAEVLYAMTEGKSDPKALTEKYVLPRFELAYDLNSSSPIAVDIKTRMTEIKRRFDMDPNVMRNGRIIPEKRWSASVAQKSSYDSNITLSNGLPTVQASQKDAFIFETVAQGNYKAPVARLFTVTPDLRATWKKHSDQASEAVHFNDAYTITPSLQNTFEHKFQDRPASTLLDYEYNYTAQDSYKRHEMQFFGRYHMFTLGERLPITSKGDTTAKAKYKTQAAYSHLLESNTWTASLDQLLILSPSHILFLMAQADYIRFPKNSVQDMNSYLFLASWIIPEILPKFTLSTALSLTFLNPTNQKASRGVEKTYNPSVKLTRNATEKLKVSFAYSYTEKTSKNEAAFAYKKHLTGLEIKYDF